MAFNNSGTFCEQAYIVENGFMNYTLGNHEPDEIERPGKAFWRHMPDSRRKAKVPGLNS